MRLGNSANRSKYLAGGVKTVGARNGTLPAHVQAKKAKGKIYYYFNTGRRNERGRIELTRPHPRHWRQ